MNILWIGIPCSKLIANIEANHFAINPTFEIHEITSPTSFELIPTSNLNYKNFSSIKESYSLLDKLPYMIDIWSRWDLGSDLNWQQLSQNSLQIVENLVSIISDLKIKKVIAAYAAPHHFWNNIVELACEISCMPVLHLYPFLELDISLPILSNNHTFASFPQFDPDDQWSSYISSTMSPYFDRLSKVAFSPESKKCFKRRFQSVLYTETHLYFRTLKSMLSAYLKKSIPYAPLSFAGLKTNPFSTHVSLHRIHAIQRQAIRFYQNNIPPVLNFSKQGESPTFLLIGHVQPEASTAPMGGKFYSQIKVVQYLRSKSKNCKILYKEHPGSFYTLLPGGNETLVGVARSVDYYKELLSLGVEFLPVEGNVISLLREQKHLIPVTITGSVAIEAPVSISSPCIYFGEPYWHGYPGSIYYKDVDWSNIDEQFVSIRAKPSDLTQNSIDWLMNRASLSCLPNIMGYGISSNEICFPDALEDLFYSRLNYCLTS